MRERERVRLTLVPMPSSLPFAVRLRNVLKDLKRIHALRCVVIDWTWEEPVKEEDKETRRPGDKEEVW
jgi:hypothetical protein